MKHLLPVVFASILVLLMPAAQAATAVATFAGGCFWCSEADFEKLPGVQSVVSGYTGGKTINPSYEQVSSGASGHLESVEVRYDPARISYPSLLAAFWHNHDYFDAGGQFCDRGSQYAAAIFTHDAAQAEAAALSKHTLEQRLKKKVATRILPAGTFYVAEDYHQDYYRKNSLRYHYYRLSCGRDARLKKLAPALQEHRKEEH